MRAPFHFVALRFCLVVPFIFVSVNTPGCATGVAQSAAQSVGMEPIAATGQDQTGVTADLRAIEGRDPVSDFQGAIAAQDFRLVGLRWGPPSYVVFPGVPDLLAGNASERYGTRLFDSGSDWIRSEQHKRLKFLAVEYATRYNRLLLDNIIITTENGFVRIHHGETLVQFENEQLQHLKVVEKVVDRSNTMRFSLGSSERLTYVRIYNPFSFPVVYKAIFWEEGKNAFVQIASWRVAPRGETLEPYPAPLQQVIIFDLAPYTSKS